MTSLLYSQKVANELATSLDKEKHVEPATDLLQLSISDALISESYLIRVFAIMDKRVGKRTLEAIRN